MIKIIQTLMAIGRQWRTPAYSLRQEAIECAASEFCLSKPSFALALDWMFEQWTEKNLLEGLEKIKPYQQKKFAVQVLAGNTPAMTAQGFLQGALLNIPQCVKIPSNQDTFAKLLFQSFLENSDHFSEICGVICHAEALYPLLSKADLVIAYGHDETISELKKYIAPNAVFITHGHTESAAIIFKEEANVSSLKNLAQDMLSYDQRGCLSPRITFVEQGGELSPAEYTQLFAEKILPVAAEKFPRGGLFAGEAEEILHQRITYGFSGKVYTGIDWTVCYNEKINWPKYALPRFMLFKSFKDSDELVAFLHLINMPLMSLGYAGAEGKMLLFQKFTERFAALGHMQRQLMFF